MKRGFMGKKQNRKDDTNLKPVIDLLQRKIVKIRYKKLPKRTYGTCEIIIEIDPRRNKKKGKKEIIDTLAHEGRHGISPFSKEGQVIKWTEKAMKRMSKKDERKLRRVLKKRAKWAK